ncbi:hypothetical protein LR48_Vigan07g188900 [Vigna angularis]|uniref:Putative plant transposon protein domain-containing protein n=1 Tax=Phaseolus angularis TaxID=3914 RepID=A0A0L9UZ96_PHAAN|nr:hypothetical protein LR48_Vigan07g188900 [Vigna angularis]
MEPQLKLGTPVRFKNKLWVVKDFKENGAIEIEASYSRVYIYSWMLGLFHTLGQEDQDFGIKTLGSKRKDKEQDRSYSNKFLAHKHERHFNVVQDRRLLKERKVGLIPDFAPQFGEQLENRNWGRLATYPTPTNIAVVKEFYTNARRLGDHPVEDYLRYVRGHTIRYDPDSINRFLNTEWTGEQCQFALNMEEGADFGDVESVLCVPSGHFHRKRNGVVVNIRRADMTPLAKPRKAIDEAYYRQYCRADEAAHPVPPRRPRRGRGPPHGQTSAEPQEAEPFQMTDMYISLIDARMQSIHKGQVATTKMIIGMYDTPPAHRWTMDEFHNVVAWPEEQAQGSRARAAEASTMDDKDAFEDAEDDEDEEDSDDSMG